MLAVRVCSQPEVRAFFEKNGLRLEGNSKKALSFLALRDTVKLLYSSYKNGCPINDQFPRSLPLRRRIPDAAHG